MLTDQQAVKLGDYAASGPFSTAQTAREQPDVAIVGLGLSSEHALDLIGEIVREASCPVIALIHANDPAYIHEAAKEASLLTPRRDPRRTAKRDRHHAAALHRVPQPPRRRSGGAQRSSKPKGILMARHAIDADRAFEMLRDHSQHNGRKLADVAAAVIESHLLLLPASHDGPSGDAARGPARPAPTHPGDPGGAEEP